MWEPGFLCAWEGGEMKARREMTQAGFEFRAKTHAGAGLEDDMRFAAIVECASDLSQLRGERCESPTERKAIRRAKAHPFKQTQPDAGRGGTSVYKPTRAKHLKLNASEISLLEQTDEVEIRRDQLITKEQSRPFIEEHFYQGV